MFPGLFLDLLIKPVQLFTGVHQLPFESFQGKGIEALLSVSHASWYLILLVIFMLGVRKLVLLKRTITVLPTWNCAYTAPTSKIQYTASSFVKTYSKLFGMFFLIFKKGKEVKGIFPTVAYLETRPYDKIEKWLIDYPTTNLKLFLGRFRFVQNGRLQFYILYGILFIVSIIIVPMLYDKITMFIEFLKEL
jgi:hypothetical protein